MPSFCVDITYFESLAPPTVSDGGPPRVVSSPNSSQPAAPWSIYLTWNIAHCLQVMDGDGTCSFCHPCPFPDENGVYWGR
eukprot:SAG22_NODE_887_length_6660_cov_2.023929_3_plen_80_part_00